MSYEKRDFEIVDYQMYRLQGTQERYRGPKPQNLTKGGYFVCLGGAQTLGRFCEKPYPTLLQNQLNIPVLNLGQGGAIPDWFSQRKEILEYINNAKFAIIQVMSARTVSNSLFKSKLSGPQVIKRDTGISITADEAYQQLIQAKDWDKLREIAQETRQNWVDSYKHLLAEIKVPKILLWISKREPQYQENYEQLEHEWQLFKAFPQMINLEMINQIKIYCDEYVECISKKGLPQLLVSRFTGKLVINTNGKDAEKTYNNYYPSPEMHLDVANALKPVCQAYLDNTKDLKNDVEYCIKQAEYFQQKDELEKAFFFYLRALDLNPRIQSKLLAPFFDLGRALAKKSNWDKATSCYQKVIQINPDFHEAYLYLGDIYKSQDNLDEAINYYIKATQIKPNYYLSYVRIKRLIKKTNLSQNQLEKINQLALATIKKYPSNKQVQSILPYSLILLNNIPEAIQKCQEITRHNNLTLKPEFVNNYWSQGKPHGPDFIIVGFMKCGTTSLYDYILQHPRILPASQKEIMFFNDDKLFQLGTDWYLSNFPPIPDKNDYVTGEASTMYVHSSLVAQRLKDFFPETKIIVILRNPVARAISHYFFNAKQGVIKNKTIEKVIDLELNKIAKVTDFSKYLDGKNGIISAGLYVYFLKTWMSIFPKKQFLILETENLAKAPEFLMEKVFKFLGLSNYEISKSPKKNSGSYRGISDELICKISDFYRPHNQLLEEYIGTKFNWE